MDQLTKQQAEGKGWCVGGIDIVISKDFFPTIGGAHAWLYEVYRRWPSAVQFVTPSYTSTPVEPRSEAQLDSLQHGAIEIVKEGSSIEEINLLQWDCLKAFYTQVQRINKMARNAFTRLHCLRAFPEGFSGLLFKRLRPRSSKLVTYAHGEEILIAQTSRQLSFIAKLVYAGSDLIIANSENTNKLVRTLCPRAKVITVHPGVNAESYCQPREELHKHRFRWGWPQETIIVCTVARMEPRKNHAMVIKSIRELRTEGISIGYVCGSDGQEKNRLLEMVTDLKLQNWVHFVGNVTDGEKRLIYGSSDIHAMPSIQVGEMIEGFGIVFLEAAAAGIPSIAGNIGGQSEAVLHGTTGLVVNGAALEEVKNAMRVLAADRSLRERMGREGVRWALEHDWARITKKTYAAISSLEDPSVVSQ